MREKSQAKRGLAAMEFALLLPVVALLLFFLTEGANAMHAYHALVEASREGARLVLMEGEEANVDVLVKSLADELTPEHLTATVTKDAAANTVTVEVSYAYQALWSQDVLEMLSGSPTLRLVADTTMPLP